MAWLAANVVIVSFLRVAVRILLHEVNSMSAFLGNIADWLDRHSLVTEVLGGALLALAIVLPVPLIIRATVISAGYELLVDRNNADFRQAAIDFAQREAAIVAVFILRAIL